MYELKTENFSGPIEKLLELIEKKDLEITELSLAAVTADFVKYLNALTNADKIRTNTESPLESVSSPNKSVIMPRLLADFVVVASRLLLIKSRALLPNFQITTEEEVGIKDLEAQLKFYQNFKPAITHLKNLWEAERYSIARPFMAGRPVIFYPSGNITTDNLLQAMSKIFEAINQAKMETETMKSPLVSLEEKIQEIINLFQEKTTMLKFKDIKSEKSRSEIIVTFLALLQLINSQLVRVEQSEHFSDITIEKN